MNYTISTCLSALSILFLLNPLHAQNTESSEYSSTNPEGISAINADTLIPFYVTDYDETWFWSVKDGLWGIVTPSLKQMVEPRYAIPYLAYEDYFDENCEFETNFPIIMMTGESESVLFEPIKGEITADGYKSIIPFDETYFLVETVDNQFGLINKVGEVIIAPNSGIQPFPWLDSAFIVTEGSTLYHVDIRTLERNKITSKKIKLQILKELLYSCDLFDYTDSKKIKDEEVLLYLASQQENAQIDSLDWNRVFGDLHNGGYMWYCDIMYCLKTIDERFTNKDEWIACFSPGYGTFEEWHIEFNNKSETIWEVETNILTTGNGHGDQTYYAYYKYDEYSEQFTKIEITDLFKLESKMKKFLDEKVREAFNTDELKEYLPDLSTDSIYTNSGNWKLGVDGVVLSVDYFFSGNYQVVIDIDYQDLKKWIRDKDLIAAFDDF